VRKQEGAGAHEDEGAGALEAADAHEGGPREAPTVRASGAQLVLAVPTSRRRALPPRSRRFIVGLWPAYHLMTPLVVFALFMGAVMGTHFIPAF